jgi:hypothetical protein
VQQDATIQDTSIRVRIRSLWCIPVSQKGIFGYLTALRQAVFEWDMAGSGRGTFQDFHTIVQHPVACAITVTTITVYATLFMHCPLLEDAPLPRHVSVQVWTIFKWYTCGSYENYYTYNGSVVLGSMSFGLTYLVLLIVLITLVKVKLSRNRPWRLTGLWDVKDPTLSRQPAVRLSAPRTGRTLLPRNIIIFLNVSSTHFC